MRKPRRLWSFLSLALPASALAAAAAAVPHVLPSGATVTLPASARGLESDKPTEQRFVLGGSTLIHIQETTEKDCAAFLQQTFDGTNQARGDASPTQLVRVDKLEWRTVGGRKVVYAELASRNAEEAKAGKPLRAIALAALCHDNTSFGADVSQRNGKLTPAAIKLLDETVASLTLGKPLPAAPAPAPEK